MLKIFVLFSLSLLVQSESKIVGGSPAVLGQFPYHVGVRNRVGVFLCSGTLISEYTVLTTALCIWGKTVDDIYIHVGTVSLVNWGTRYQSTSVIPHPEYEKNNLVKDIGLVLVGEGIILGDNVRPIPLGNDVISEGSTGTFTGWGAIRETGGVVDILNYVRLSTISLDQCRSLLAGSLQITDDHICTFDSVEDDYPCMEDEGGPLVINGKVVGTLSWISSCQKRPSAFTSVASFYDWIMNNMDVAP